MAPASTPRSIGPYTLERELGRGGMGIVYAARTEAGVKVALKLLLPGHHGPQAAARFTREAEVLASLSDPNLVTCLDVGSYHGSPYLVMERLTEETLATRTRKIGRWSALDAIRVGAQIASGLGAMHEAGLVHRDVKPENVLLSGTGQAKLSDLGLVTGQDFSRMTATEELVGTPAYMAPEQIRGDPTTPATDVYSMGVLLFELIEGRLPFNRPVALALFRAHLVEPAPRLEATEPGIAELVADCLAKDPSQRPASGNALFERLQGLEAASSSAPFRLTSQPRWILVAAIGVALASSMLALALWAQGPSTPPEAETHAAERHGAHAAWTHALRMELSRAESLAEAYATEHPNDAEGHLVLGRVQGLRLKHHAARRSALRGLNCEPGHMGLLGLQHVMARRLKRTQEALAVRSELKRLHPQGVDTYLAIVNDSKAGEARRIELEHALDRFPDSLRVRLACVSLEALTIRSDSLLRASIAESPEAAPLLRYFRVQGLEYGGKPQAALDALRAGFPGLETHPDLLCLEARLLGSVGQFEAGCELARRATRLEPTLWRAWIQLVTLAADAGDEATVRDACAKGLAAVYGSTRWRFHYELARSALRTKEFAEALVHAQRIEGDREAEGARYEVESQALLRLGRIEEALTKLEAWAELEPSHVTPLARLAKYQSAREDHRAAEAAALRALELDPENAACWEILGGSRYMQGEIGLRLEQPLREALRLKRDTSKIRMLLALICLDSGRSSEAREHLERVKAKHAQKPLPKDVQADYDRIDTRLRLLGE